MSKESKEKQLSDEEEMLMRQEMEILAAQQASASQNIPYSAAMFGGGNKQNLIEWELDFKPELENIERLLRSDILVRDKDGNEYWTENPNKDEILFNDLGVSDIIRNIITIVNKNKALANYDHLEINDRVRQMKHELRVLIYNNFEKYGMDNEYKMNNYSMVVISTGSIIEDVYRRAMNGETHKGLSEQRLVQQSEPLMPQNFNFSMGQPQKKGIISRAMPWNWGK